MGADKSSEDLLRERAGSPSYTPGRRELDALLDLYLSESADETLLARALLRAAAETLRLVSARLPLASGATRARLVRLLARLYTSTGEPTQAALLAQILADPDEQSARQAARGLGKSPPALRPLAEAALLARLKTAREAATLRILVDSLGKVGGSESLAALRELQRERGAGDSPVDPELRRLLGEALQRLQRDAVRAESVALGGSILVDVSPPVPLELALRCRAGLGEALADELHKRGLVAAGAELTVEESDAIGQPSQLRLRTRLPLSHFVPSRLWSELALAIPLRPLAPVATALPRDVLVTEVAQAVAQPAVLAALRALTRGPVRYRIQLTGGGHQRALVKELGLAIAQRAPLLQNDPKDCLWQLELELDDDGRLRLWFRPRALPDARFAYRRGDVPAASHPTVAAALAWVARLREGEVIWDPFAGSGSELAEAGLLCPSARLLGSDLSERALAVANQNLEAAGVLGRTELYSASALERPPAGVTLVLTNPPMGRRVRIADTADLLSRFVASIGRSLPVGGRLVWISPQPLVTERPARLAGLGLRYAQRIDMNGFWARLEVWEKEATSS